MKALSTAPLEQSRQIEWCFLFREQLNERATLTWYLVTDSRFGECVIFRTLIPLDSIPSRDRPSLVVLSTACRNAQSSAQLVQDSLMEWALSTVHC
jgi:hypothetical protein